MESGWVMYGPENGYNFPYPHFLNVKCKFQEVCYVLMQGIWHFCFGNGHSDAKDMSEDVCVFPWVNMYADV